MARCQRVDGGAALDGGVIWAFMQQKGVYSQPNISKRREYEVFVVVSVRPETHFNQTGPDAVVKG